VLPILEDIASSVEAELKSRNGDEETVKIAATNYLIFILLYFLS
jgi:hypothetical protein